jgi:hypothetical protein
MSDLTSHPMAEGDSRKIAYQDVLDAWNAYLAHDNHGRGVVLIGHSQGTGILTGLIASEIDGNPVQRRLVSAILIGDDVQVAPGKDVGGSFKHIPLCRAPAQTGCAIAFSNFRADSPPPSNSMFGQGDKAAGTVAACTNPAALGGGSGEEKAFLPNDSKEAVSMLDMTKTQPSWTDPPKTITTPFVELPGLLTAECISNAHGNYLAVTVHPTPGGQRVNDIGGDVVFGGKVQPNWGLHLVDVNLTLGNLLDVVGDESRAYLAQSGS